MIDSTKSPVPAWKRYTTIALLAVLVVIAAFVIYTKEIHHSSSGSPASQAPAPVVSTTPSTANAKPSAPTTIPGGIPVSNRNPFA